MPQHQLGGPTCAVLAQVPNARGRVSRPGSQEVVDWVPGADEDLGFVAPQDHGFALRDLHVPVHLHHVRVVICTKQTLIKRAGQEDGTGTGT